MTNILKPPFTGGRRGGSGECAETYQLSDEARYISGEFINHISRINSELKQQKEDSTSLKAEITDVSRIQIENTEMRDRLTELGDEMSEKIKENVDKLRGL